MDKAVPHVHPLLCSLVLSCDLTFNLLGVGLSSAVYLRWTVGNVMGRMVHGGSFHVKGQRRGWTISLGNPDIWKLTSYLGFIKFLRDILSSGSQ